MTAITAACTCTVDGVSGTADTRYKGYSFTGCGAHVDYHLNQLSGAGYEITWCYVTSPPDCPGESPYIPEGFKDDNTLLEWKNQGAAWKQCYDGYRCEAWWGELVGSPEGEAVILDAPLDWPDCCALCSKSIGGGAPIDATCAAWSFDPSSGSCQLMSSVSSLTKAPGSWGSNSTIHGYPGYFEAPVTGCWGRGTYDLCENMNLYLLIPGIIFTIFGLCYTYLECFVRPLRQSRELRGLLKSSSQLVKTSCVEVRSTRIVKSRGKNGEVYEVAYRGVFQARDGSLYTIPPRDRPLIPADLSGRGIENKMLSVLFTERLRPLQANSDLMLRCETPEGRRSVLLRLISKAERKRETSVGDNRFSSVECYDSLLLKGIGREVLLVGILGEDRLTCIDPADFGFGKASILGCGCVSLSIAFTLLITLCVALLTSEAAQIMADWTFPGTNYRDGAVAGLVICGSFPFALLMSRNYIKAKLTRLFRDLRPLVDGTPA